MVTGYRRAGIWGVLNREPWIAEHQIRIWYPQPLSLPCSVNDAVNLLPCSTCAYLYGRLSWAALPFQDDAGFRPAPDYGSGGQAACAGRCHTLRSRSGWTWMPWLYSSGVLGAGCPAWPLPQCPHACGSRGCPQCRGVRVAGRRHAASSVRASGQPVPAPAASTYLTSADEQTHGAALPSRRNGGCGSAVVLRRPAGQPDTAAGVQVVAEPDTADALAV
jgi:hypothetical protein